MVPKAEVEEVVHASISPLDNNLILLAIVLTQQS